MPGKKMLVYLLAFISLGAFFSFLSSPVFKIQGFDYQGLHRLRAGDIDSILEPFRQVNILLVDTEQVEKRLEGNQHILAAEVKKGLPNSLRVRIEERIPLAKINNNGSYLVFTGDGYILEKGPFRVGEGVPEILGAGYQLRQNRIDFTPAMAEIVQALAGLKPTPLAQIARIDLEGERLSLELKSSTRVILSPDGDLGESFQIMESIIIKMLKERLLVDYIDLSIPQKPVIRLKDKA